VLEGLGVLARGPTGAGEQHTPLRLQAGNQVVAGAAGHFAKGGAQRGLEVTSGVPDCLLHLLARALFDPQQTGNAPVLRLAGAAPGELKTQQLRQLVLGLLAGKGPAAHLQVAALLLEKALCQIPALPLPEEFHRHLGGGGGVAPGLEVVHTAGLVAFKESRADRPHQGALSGFVGPGKQVDAVVKAIDHQRLAELAELFDANVLNLHGADPGPWASLSSWVRITRASRAVSPWGPCWASRSSVS